MIIINMDGHNERRKTRQDRFFVVPLFIIVSLSLGLTFPAPPRVIVIKKFIIVDAFFKTGGETLGVEHLRRNMTTRAHLILYQLLLLL